MVEMMNDWNDTIVAISTPPGRGGIGIVRLSGPRAKQIAESLVRLSLPLEPGRARFAEVLDVDSAIVLDQAVVTYFAGPRSYTGEDVVEIAAHGAPVLLDALLRRCVSAGARLAQPGEFTQRAFLAGRIDLTQAEAVHDLIQSTTLEQARTAARQMGGGLSRQVKPVKERLIGLIAGLEAGIDFAEDDLEVMGSETILAAMREIEAPLTAMEESFAYGRILREGFKLAIVGRPNVGKSSLFNKLIRRDRAIVTAQAGTTRDPVAEQLDLAGIPVELIDTAGLRLTQDEAEAYGIAKSREAMAEAEIVLLVIAADKELHEEDRAAIEESLGRRLVVVLNKIDLVEDTEQGRRAAAEDSLNEYLERTQERSRPVVIATSAITGDGLDRLRETIVVALRDAAPTADSAPVTNLRQHQAITAAVAAMSAAERGLDAGVPHEMVLLDLHEALSALDELTGTTHVDEILGVIFAKFCIGK